jgi:hypothetical protein
VHPLRRSLAPPQTCCPSRLESQPWRADPVCRAVLQVRSATLGVEQAPTQVRGGGATLQPRRREAQAPPGAVPTMAAVRADFVARRSAPGPMDPLPPRPNSAAPHSATEEEGRPCVLPLG